MVLANYPTYRFTHQLQISPASVQRVTSWNETLAEFLAKLPDVRVHVITLCKAKRTTTVRQANLSITFMAVPKFLNISTFFGFPALKAVQMINSIKPDIVHGIGTEHIWPTTALLSGYPTVVTVHGIMTNIVEKLRPPWLSRLRWFALLEKQVLRRARYLISISPYIMLSLGKFTEAKIFSVENSVAPNFFQLSAQPGRSKKILFVGDTERRKSLLTLLKAFSAALQDDNEFGTWQLVVIGLVKKGAYYEEIMWYIREQGLDNNVIFKGFLLPDQLFNEYRSSALLALSSVEETAPMCIAEAMAVGLPVVATSVSGIPHMVRDGETGLLCEVNHPTEMANCLLKLMKSPLLRDKMGKQAKLEACQRWNPRVIAQQTLDVYRFIVNSNNHGK